MIKINIEIDDLRKIDERKVEIPSDLHYFSITMSYLINDFADKNNISTEDVLKNINNDLCVIRRFK